jgi:hypothetical protein
MDYKNTEMLIRIAHISELLKTLALELDKLYDSITKDSQDN